MITFNYEKLTKQILEESNKIIREEIKKQIDDYDLWDNEVIHNCVNKFFEDLVKEILRENKEEIKKSIKEAVLENAIDIALENVGDILLYGKSQQYIKEKEK